MKLILPLLLLICAPFAGLALPPVSLLLPPVVFADTETTTNAQLVVWRDDVREFTFSLECLGGPEDNVQISFGTDSNTNGILDLAECELTVGYYAPLDSQGGVDIVRQWCDTRTSLGDVDAWMKANDCRSGHNACSIRRISESEIEYQCFLKQARFFWKRSVFNIATGGAQ